MKPTAHNRTPKRITLKKHESVVDMMQQDKDRLESDISSMEHTIENRDAVIKNLERRISQLSSLFESAKGALQAQTDRANRYKAYADKMAGVNQ